jgi:hypothetical protein
MSLTCLEESRLSPSRRSVSEIWRFGRRGAGYLDSLQVVPKSRVQLGSHLVGMSYRNKDYGRRCGSRNIDKRVETKVKEHEKRKDRLGDSADRTQKDKGAAKATQGRRAQLRVCRLIIPLSSVTLSPHRAAHFLGWTIHIPSCPLPSDNHVRPPPRPRAPPNQLHPGSPTPRRNRRIWDDSPWDPRRRTGVTRVLFPLVLAFFRMRITCSTSGPRSRGTSSPRRVPLPPGSLVPLRTSAPAAHPRLT